MSGKNREVGRIGELRLRLLEWYDQNQRDLPWRRTRDPYAIWVSEIMLQQTRVAVVVERFRAFMERFPTVNSLACAPEQDVLALWSGLGYYRRARMLHKAAQIVVGDLHAVLPTTAEGLNNLPGIGAYTSAAIASIAHDECVAVVDGNVERVLCRLQGWGASERTAHAASKRNVGTFADAFIEPARPGDFNQALMELGATVCLPRNPHCLACPLAAECCTLGEHKKPVRPAMSSKEVAFALVMRTHRESGFVREELLLEQRLASNSVMPEMWELPPLRDSEVPVQELRMTVRHAIMQINYIVHVRTVSERDFEGMTDSQGRRRWVSVNDASGMALTGLTRKVLSRARLLPKSSRASIAPTPATVVS